jgi:hypothetical protein
LRTEAGRALQRGASMVLALLLCGAPLTARAATAGPGKGPTKYYTDSMHPHFSYRLYCNVLTGQSGFEYKSDDPSAKTIRWQATDDFDKTSQEPESGTITFPNGFGKSATIWLQRTGRGCTKPGGLHVYLNIATSTTPRSR